MIACCVFENVEDSVGILIVFSDKVVKPIEHEDASARWSEWIVSHAIVEGVQIASPGLVTEMFLPL